MRSSDDTGRYAPRPGFAPAGPGLAFSRICDVHGGRVYQQSGGRVIRRGPLRLWACHRCAGGKA